MALIESTISFFCALTPSNISPHCNTVTKATSAQVGVTQEVNKTEGLANNYVVIEARKMVGDKGLIAGGVGYTAYQLYSKQPVEFDTPSTFLCDSIAGGVAPDKYTLTLRWKW